MTENQGVNLVSILSKEELAKMGDAAREYSKRKGQVIYREGKIEIRKGQIEEQGTYFLYIDREEFLLTKELFRVIASYTPPESTARTILENNPNMLHALNKSRIYAEYIPLVFARAYIAEMDKKIKDMETKNCSPTLKLILENRKL